MINFTDAKLYLKGTCQAIATDKQTGNVLYFSNKFQTGNITTSVSMGEIRAGLGNGVAAIIPSDAGLNVEFTAADFNLWAKTAQVGGTLQYNAPSMVCEVVTATGASLTITMEKGTPVAAVGYTDIFCYVQEVGEAAGIATTGVAYELNPTSGAISGFAATAGHTYKVWYTVNKASAQMATIPSFIDPKVVNFTAMMAVYSNDGSAMSESTRVGWLYVVVPNLKLGGNGGVVGDQSTSDTTSLSGMAVAYDPAVISADCNACGASSSAFAYYIYVPDDASQDIVGLALIGGVTTVAKSGTAQADVRFVMKNGELVVPGNRAQGFTYQLTSAPSGTTVNASGVISAGSTAGECELSTTYQAGNVNVTLSSDVVVSA